MKVEILNPAGYWNIDFMKLPWVQNRHEKYRRKGMANPFGPIVNKSRKNT